MLENENMIDLLGSLKEMSSDQLSHLIQEETAKESPNDELVLMIMDILEDREKENPIELGPKGKAAWKKYQLKVRARDRRTVLIWKPLMQVASVMLVITLLFALLPTKANAETWWERLAKWTDDFFSFFNPNESDVPEDVYVFQTDNEGLQQIYDAAIKLGINEPVVPMWLPEDYVLVDIIRDSMPTQNRIISRFTGSNGDAVFQIVVQESNKTEQYYKDRTPVDEFELNGATFSVIRNNENWVVIWAKDNIECAFSIDCQEDILYDIIDSIYRRRINE